MQCKLIDLDLIAYEGAGDPALPDPEIAVRPFLAAPLAELWPALRLPGQPGSLGDIAASLDRTGLTPLGEYTARLREEVRHEP